MSAELKEGDLAPDFKLPSTKGDVSLKDLRGRKVVLYFYPKDDTPGCTREACNFRDSIDRITAEGAVVLGVSRDSLESHKRFAAKYGLPFNLLSDEDTDVIRKYGIWKLKKAYGREYEGVERSTFLIDEKGRIQRIWRAVQVDDHNEEVLSALG